MSPTPQPLPRRPRRADLIVAVIAVALAIWVTSALWLDPNGRAVAVNSGDQALFEWLLAFGGHSLVGLDNPLLTGLLNAPDQVNLAVNTSITVLAWLFAPVTFLFGPSVSFLAILTLNLAGSAYAWYWLFQRKLDMSPVAAGVAGIFAGFAPALVSHANSHLNWTAQWLIPLILANLMGLHRRPLRRGILLGLLVGVTFSIAAEALFFTALAWAVFLLVWVPARRDRLGAVVKPYLKGLGITAIVAGILLAYPLYLHFAGPQRYEGTGFDHRIHSEDVAAYGSFPKLSLAGALGLNSDLAPNPTEENSFFGLPLLLVAIACLILLWRLRPERRATLRALAVTGGVFALLSFGPRIKFAGTSIDIPLPYAFLGKLPVFDAALPARLALVVAPIIALILALALDELPRLPAGSRRVARPVLIAGLVAGLLPLFPIQIPAVERPRVPHFISSGEWKTVVPPGGVLVPVPLPSDVLPDGQRWQASALAADPTGEVFTVPAGFFLGPGGPDGRGRIGPVPRPTAALLEQVANTGEVPVVYPSMISAAQDDLAYWQADAVVLPTRPFGRAPIHTEALLETMTKLLGAPQRRDDVWVWQVS
ncbi:hypothetical protein F4553_002890 [Allocatelliglobosispora scoriae]|uniref:DUF6311 domain-containing protein n=1 Tax=Allocatelliglobosispora scoriae TaxID=643052 RepID=A0A841BRS9_9ACTN|nr:DUF2079 domain-containing protein [Allocatelliglobosispora scoriae]MBB5869511.1 hypothetical protein [Allocatelliglobosispora scoriae]